MSHAPKLTGSGRIIGMSESHIEIDATQFAAAEWHQGYYDLLHVAGGVRVIVEPVDASEHAAPEPETPAPMPDRDALGRAVHAAWLDLRESNFGKRPSLAWDDLEDDLQELDRCVGERIFNMGALHGKQIEPADRAPAECPHCGASRVTR